MAKSSTLRKILVNVAKFGVAAGILFYLYEKGMLDFSKVRSTLTDPTIVIISFSLMTLNFVAGVFRWKLLLEGQGLKITFVEAFKLSMIGVFFNTALPGAVSGDVVKGYYVVRSQPDGRGKIRAFTTLLLDRILGLSALILISFVMMLFNLDEMQNKPVLKSLSGFISLLFVGTVIFYVLVLGRWKFFNAMEKLLKKLPGGDHWVRLFDAVRAYESCRHIILKGILISVAIHCTILGVFLLLSRSLGGFEMVTWDKFYFLAPLGMLVTAIPVAPAGLGTGHMAFAWLFKQVGSASGANLFTAFVAFQIFISLVGGLFYVRYKAKH